MPFYDAPAQPPKGTDVLDTARNRIRLPLLLGLLVVLATGCDGNPAQPWHYWISIVLLASALLILFVALPIGWWIKVGRLKYRGR
ncbi:MAG: hypothetical protein FJW88_04650 [Actinobacteria bacterium]|nr:hypothetical protein [Actinomycetota bacterium]